jgi:hypothetical protein
MDLPRDSAFDEVDLDATSRGSPGGDSCGRNTLDNITALGLSFNCDDTEIESTIKRQRFSLDDVDDFANRSLPLDSELPFNKWIKKLEKRGTGRRKTVSCDLDASALERELFESPAPNQKSVHKKSSSGSSFGFVTAVKSASISLASFSIAPRSRRTGISSRHHRTDRSSKTSQGGRLSEDSSFLARGAVMDQAVTNRLLQRRRILEEIISTEENYIADVKFLTNVCTRITQTSTFANVKGLCDPPGIYSVSFDESQSINQEKSQRYRRAA